MDGERISLRLESEDLNILDEFIESHPEYSNRSNLARVAIREFIENSDGLKLRAKPASENEVVLSLPPKIYTMLQYQVTDGFYNSIEDVVMHYIRKVYEDKLEETRKKSMEIIAEDSPFKLIDR